MFPGAKVFQGVEERSDLREVGLPANEADSPNEINTHPDWAEKGSKKPLLIKPYSHRFRGRYIAAAYCRKHNARYIPQV